LELNKSLLNVFSVLTRRVSSFISLPLQQHSAGEPFAWQLPTVGQLNALIRVLSTSLADKHADTLNWQ